MKNDNNSRNVKQVSRLTGALLARKGTAKPAQVNLSTNKPVINRFSSEQGERNRPVMSDQRESSQPEISQRESSQPEISQRESSQPEISQPASSFVMRRGHSSETESGIGRRPEKKLAKKRVAMTLRMGPESHFRLRLFSAHTRRSCQDIISEALEEYLDNNADRLSMRDVAGGSR